MNFPGFNPSMLNNMNMDQMKMASDMLSGMSDEQLRSYAKMMGMPHMDPQVLRNNAGMMKNMDQSQFNNVKNAAKNYPFPPSGGASPSNSTSNSSTTTQQTSASQTSVPAKYSHIEKLKLKGNDYYKKGAYDEASGAYLEAIIEIEEVKSRNKKIQDDELDNLEVSCRLNYANVKAKEEDYEVVLAQARAVLNVKENGKAYFRLGQALNHFKKYEEAQRNLEKAIEMLPGDNTVTELYEKVKEKTSKIKKEASQTNDKEVLENNEKKEVSETKATDGFEETKKPEENKPKMKKKNAPEVDVPITKTEKKPAATLDPAFDYLGSQKNSNQEVVIEEEKIQEEKTVPQRETTKPSYPPNFSEETLRKGQEQFANMDPNQMKMMTDYFKGMDNASLKNMLRSQTGMDISDSQLEMMKTMMTPETLQNFSKMNMSDLPKFPTQSTTSTARTGSESQSTPATEPSFPSGQGGFPGAGAFPAGMDLKSEQVQNMIEMVIQNPEMLKNMVGMLGENNPVAKFIKNKSPEELAKYMRIFKKLFKVYGKVSPLINFIRKYWQLFAGALIACILYRYVL